MQLHVLPNVVTRNPHYILSNGGVHYLIMSKMELGNHLLLSNTNVQE